MSAPSPRGLHRVERALFCGFLATYAYFHQGGGWNQNGRFAQVRAVAEEGRLAIDSYLVYEPREAPAAEPAFSRSEVRGGAFLRGGMPYHLGWPDGTGRMIAAGEPAAPGVEVVPLVQVAATGDVSYGRGSFYPNKAPGTALLAVPGYALLFHAERLLGLDPDTWRMLTIHLWLASALSVGLIAALGCVVFFRSALALSKGRVRSSLYATLAFGLGTLYFPYATMLFEHDVVAVALLVSFYLLMTSRERGARTFLGGLAAGVAVTASYVAAAAAPILAGYLIAKRRDARSLAGFAAGVAIPCLLLAAYHAVCFGSAFATPYAFENPAFHSTSARLLSIFGAPDAGIAAALLFSPFRGLFVSSPILLLGAGFLGWMLRGRERRAEALVCVAMVALFLVVNASFNGWHGGAALAPRYLGPAIPFLALPLVLAFDRVRLAAGLLALLSIVTMLLGTAVDPQCPLGVLPIAPAEGSLWRANPWTQYEAPLFASERATSQADGSVLASLEGPVSVNPIGAYEGWFYLAFPPGSREARWNSFNLGEGLFPRSRMSLVPLLVVWGAMLAASLGAAREASRRERAQ